MTRPAVTRPGMTLVETLVALVVLGLVAALGFSALGLVGRAGAAVAPDPTEIASVQELLRLRLSAALPVPEAREGAPGSQPALAFAGTPTRIAFAAELPARFATPGPALVEIFAAEGALRLRWRPLSGPARPGGEAAEGRALVQGIAGLRLRYFGAPRKPQASGAAAAAAPAWRDAWEDPAALPQAVELSLEFPEGDARRWPALVVAPRLALPAAMTGVVP